MEIEFVTDGQKMDEDGLLPLLSCVLNVKETCCVGGVLQHRDKAQWQKG